MTLIVADRRLEADQIAADAGLMGWEWHWERPQWLSVGAPQFAVGTVTRCLARREAMTGWELSPLLEVTEVR